MCVWFYRWSIYTIGRLNIIRCALPQLFAIDCSMHTIYSSSDLFPLWTHLVRHAQFVGDAAPKRPIALHTYSVEWEPWLGRRYDSGL